MANPFSICLPQLCATYAERALVTVLCQVWSGPLMTVNGQHMIADLARLCDGVNAFGDARPPIPIISTEAVLKTDPQVIIASGMA